MAANEIHKGDIGTKFTVTVYDGTSTVNVSGGTKTILFKKPGGTTLTKTASDEDAANGAISYTTVSGDLDEIGTWRIQAKVVTSGGSTFNTDISTFKVSPQPFSFFTLSSQLVHQTLANPPDNLKSVTYAILFPALPPKSLV